MENLRRWFHDSLRGANPQWERYGLTNEEHLQMSNFLKLDAIGRRFGKFPHEVEKNMAPDMIDTTVSLIIEENQKQEDDIQESKSS